MLRLLILALGLIMLPAPLLAAPPAEPSSPADRDGGSIHGRVLAVDYQRNTFGVDAGQRGRIEVTVMPSTSIQSTRDAGYHTFTDLRPGQRVQIFSSIADGKYVAQIIRIL